MNKKTKIQPRWANNHKGYIADLPDSKSEEALSNIYGLHNQVKQLYPDHHPSEHLYLFAMECYMQGYTRFDCINTALHIWTTEPVMATVLRVSDIYRCLGEDELTHPVRVA